MVYCKTGKLQILIKPCNDIHHSYSLYELQIKKRLVLEMKISIIISSVFIFSFLPWIRMQSFPSPKICMYPPPRKKMQVGKKIDLFSWRFRRPFWTNFLDPRKFSKTFLFIIFLFANLSFQNFLKTAATWPFPSGNLFENVYVRHFLHACNPLPHQKFVCIPLQP